MNHNPKTPRFWWDYRDGAVIVESSWHEEPIATFAPSEDADLSLDCFEPSVKAAEALIKDFEEGRKRVPQRTK